MDGARGGTDLQIKNLQLRHARKHVSAKFGAQIHTQSYAVEIQPLQVPMCNQSREEFFGDGGFEYGFCYLCSVRSRRTRIELLDNLEVGERAVVVAQALQQRSVDVTAQLSGSKVQSKINVCSGK
jgi:hypothetical protein